MMKNIINSPYRKMKALLILPVIAVILYAFARPEYRLPEGTSDSALQVQAKEVKGTVVQQSGNPLPGAIVLLKGTTEGTAVDAKGWFKLTNVPSDAALVVSYVGYKSKVIKPVFGSDMVIKMVRDTIKVGGDMMPPPPPPPPPTGKSTGNDDHFDTQVPPPPPPPFTANGEKVVKANTGEKDVYVAIEELPQFPGGQEALMKYMMENIKYPSEAVKKGIRGRVIVTFLVKSTGKLTDVKVEKPIDPFLDAEAIRLVSSMPDWKPGSQSGKAVDVIMKLSIDFKLQ